MKTRLLTTLALGLPTLAFGQELGFTPTLELIGTDEIDRTAVLEGRFPAGFRYVVLEESDDLGDTWTPMVSGALSGAEATITFRCPAPVGRSFFRVQASDIPVPDSQVPSDPSIFSVVYDDAGDFISSINEATHVLNRLAYGPTPEDFAHVATVGPSQYIEEQLNPGTFDDAATEATINAAIDDLLIAFLPGSGTPILESGSPARYFKGTLEPPVDWASPAFDDTSWLSGPTGIGYGDDDDATILDDMRDGYLTVYTRQQFEVADLSAIEALLLEVDYDDGFVAYINGIEVARENVVGTPPAFDDTAETATDYDPIVINISDAKSLLVAGTNTLAMQGHNGALSSSDFSLNPSISSGTDPEFETIASASNLKHLLHLRGIHSKRQLQSILAEFWENHFTTDYDKVQDYLEDDSNYRAAMLESEEIEDRIIAQTRFEAATIEFREFGFFYDNALGYFGDLLLHSATSPSMLIYLDSVENTAEAPNENYAREILELFAFGVDNRYTQEDIVELSKCFTGWNVRKIRPSDLAPFPDSALTPPTTGSITIATTTPIAGLGAPWSFLKGTSEPPSDWMQPGFAETGWSQGNSGIGYEDDLEDAAAAANLGTVLPDMRQTSTNLGGYTSVYLRKTLTLPDPDTISGEIAIDITYDDGYILYLNGTEVIRSRSTRNNGEFPAFDDTSSFGHEHSESSDTYNLGRSSSYIPGGENTIAIHGLNSSLTSSDFSILPRILQSEYTADSIDPVSTEGVWTFRFDPDNHNTEQKILFPGTEFELVIPEGRTGPEGIRDALDVIDMIIGHPSTAEFISVKLVNRFVSDGISLDSYHERSAPDHLLGLIDQCVQAWNSTDRPGHIPMILRIILDPAFKSSAFWTDGAFLTKAKTPIEFANSSVRALGGSVLDDDRMRIVIERMGQSFFDRDDPDGYSELGIDWIDTLGFLERMRQAQLLGENNGASYADWPLDDFTNDPDLQTISQIIAYFDALVFGGMLSEERKATITTFANSQFDGFGTATEDPFDNLTGGSRNARLRDVIAVILSAPEFHLQ